MKSMALLLSIVPMFFLLVAEKSYGWYWTGTVTNDSGVIYNIEPNSDLSNADLSNTDLSYADLRSANFSNANLSNVNLSYGRLTGANFSNANLTNAQIHHGYFNDANFAGSILIGSVLDDSRFTGSDFSGADVTGTYLDFQSKTEQEATAALEAELVSKYSLDEIRDLRMGSTMVFVTNGLATISFVIDQSTNLTEWAMVTNTTTTVTVQDDSDTKFLRFKMK